VDVIARAVGQKLSELWDQPVTVENHPGAGSTAAPALVAKSPPDGYTLLVNSSAQAYGAAFLKNLPYDPLKDFIPVAPLTSQPYVLVTGQSSGITTVAELVAAAKAKPGKLLFGSPGIGTGSHLGAERFNLAAGIKAVHVPAPPSDGIAGTIASTVAGQTAYLIAPIPLATAHIRNGKLRALGVTSKRRSPLLPEVPTIAETGIADFDYPIWYGVWVRAGTPQQVVDQLGKDIARALANAGFARLACEAWGESDEHDPASVRALREERERNCGTYLQKLLRSSLNKSIDESPHHPENGQRLAGNVGYTEVPKRRSR
jgi:tripartite-type tricarboxylate transporter receptor subunit TctC